MKNEIVNQIWEAHRVPGGLNPRRNTLRHRINKLTKIKDKNKILKTIRQKNDKLHISELPSEDIKKRWQEYTKLYKKDLHNPDNHDGAITHLEPNILECDIKWA